MGLRLLSPYFPTWSPDWQQIAFVGVQRNPYAQDIYVVEASCVDQAKGCKPQVRNLTADDPGQFSDPAWSPDGPKIAYSYRPDPNSLDPFNIWVMNADGTNRTRLTDMGGSHAAWSPDGRRIAFETHIRGAEWSVPEDETMCSDCGNVFVMEANGSNPRRLTQLLPDSGGPAWSPDGQSIAVFSAEGQDLLSGDKYFHIYVVNADGSKARRLTGGELHGLGAAWSPDGTKLVFAHDGRVSGLFLINADGTGAVQLTDESGDSAPAWNP
jgi:TolB protein